MLRRSVFNQKGGVGKTTIVCNLAAIAASRGLRTLVVDLDTQGNASQYLLGDELRDADKSIADFFEAALGFSLQTPPFASYATRSPFPNLDVIVASPKLEDLQVKLEAKQKVQKLRQSLEKLKGYDAVFIDTPPMMNFYSRSALIASDRVLIPFDCDEFSRRALYTLMDNLNELRADHNEELAIEGIVVNQFQPRAKMPARVIAELREEGQPVLEPFLTSSIRIKESHERHLPMIHLEAEHPLTRAYVELYDALPG